mmetsp:Transcript_2849/g.6251  ORF Transcript_2849/g.6251 Transcript_2849/m.6251 type:complete len:554 (+) Transcript_2849:392-2053(+)
MISEVKEQMAACNAEEAAVKWNLAPLVPWLVVLLLLGLLLWGQHQQLTILRQKLPPGVPQLPLEGPLIDRILEPALAGPPGLHELEEFMQQLPQGKVPTTYEAYNMLDDTMTPYFVQASGTFANVTGSAITVTPNFYGTGEHLTVCAENQCVGLVVWRLDLARTTGSLGLTLERDQMDATSMMTLKSDTGASLRPDGVFRDGDDIRMLAKVESKSCVHTMRDVAEDLGKKTAAWTPLYYGDIEYLPCYGAVGSKLKFFAIERGKTTPTSVSRVLDMTIIQDRARLVLYSVQFYRLLCAQRQLYPRRVVKVAAEQVATNQQYGYTRRLYIRSDALLVQKRIAPWTKYAFAAQVTVDKMKDVYRRTRDSPGVVHAEMVEYERGGGDVSDHLTLHLYPVGLPAPKELLDSEEGVARAAHGLLHGLASLKKAGLVHRDLRWDNTACSAGVPRWFLLDLEMCTDEGEEAPPGRPRGWTSDTLVEGRYTHASDLYSLGNMLSNYAHRVSSPGGQAFMAAIMRLPQEQRQSAQELLSDHAAWLHCAGRRCKDAGAQANER